MAGNDSIDDLTPSIDIALTDKAFEKMKQFGARLQDEATQTIWFQNTLICLLSALLREYRHLTVGFEKSTPLLAWACRNMLELDIYTKFVLAKGSNAADFVEDMWIDAIEIFSSFQLWIKFHDPSATMPELDQTVANFHSEKERSCIIREKYLRTSDMATAVDFSGEYQHMNKVTSKLVHATAFSVLGKPDEGKLGGLKPIFFNAGVRYAVEAFNDMNEYVDRNGVEPRLLVR